MMAFIGGAIMFGERGEKLLESVFGSLNYFWPVALIIGGAFILLRRKSPNGE
ncbi:MAG: hypothetical protein HC822_10110 [Oscillochloris sp.]|nr:hypothetical protein [Oscillochloris sp.]